MVDVEEKSSLSSALSETEHKNESDIGRIIQSISFTPRKGNSPEVDNPITYDDSEATGLSTLMVARKWKAAIKRIKENPEEVSTEITLKCFPGGNCRGLPLHLACCMRPFPPSSFILLLISSFPGAASCEEMQWGMLPLHFACMQIKDQNESNEEDMGIRVDRHVSSVQYLLKANPGAVKAKESFQGKLPIHMATASFASCPSFPQVVKNLAKAYPQSIHLEDDYGDTPIDIANRIQQWRNYCVNEKENSFASKQPLGNSDQEIDSEMIEKMFGQALNESPEQDDELDTNVDLPMQ